MVDVCSEIEARDLQSESSVVRKVQRAVAVKNVGGHVLLRTEYCTSSSSSSISSSARQGKRMMIIAKTGRSFDA